MPPAAKKVQTSSTPDVVCPLFADAEPPIYAKDVGKIRISRFEKSASGAVGGKVPLAREDYYVEGDETEVFQIDPYETSEEDLQEQFGAGQYWIDALHATTGKTLHGGRRLILGGVIKRGGVVLDEEDEDDDEDDASSRKSKNPVDSTKTMMAMMEKMFATRERLSEDAVARERDHAAKQAEMHSTFAATMFQIANAKDRPDGSSQEVVASMRRQMESMMDKSARDFDELRKSQRDELARRDREIEDLRREYREELSEERKRARSDIERRDDELKDLRARANRDEDDLRRRFQKEQDDQRTRYDRELAQAGKDLNELRASLTKENDRVRQQLEKRISELEREIHQLEKDNIELQKDLAKAQNAAPEPSSTPTAVGLIEQFAPVLQQIAAGAVRKAMEPNAGAVVQPGMAAMPYAVPEGYAPQGYPPAGYPHPYDPSMPPGGGYMPPGVPFAPPMPSAEGVEGSEPPEPEEPSDDAVPTSNAA